MRGRDRDKNETEAGWEISQHMTLCHPVNLEEGQHDKYFSHGFQQKSSSGICYGS